MTEVGWVIEHADSPAATPLYHSLTPGNGEFWVADHMRAIRFCRQQDAVEYANVWLSDADHDFRFCEHTWAALSRPDCEETKP